MGFSTGAQDVVRFMAGQHSAKNCVKGIILHSPVSDSEWFQEMDDKSDDRPYEKLAKQAQKMGPNVSF